MDRNTTPSNGKPEPGMILEVDVTGVAAGGKGVARHEGFTLLIPRAIKGERIRVEITSVKSTYGEGRVVEVLEPLFGRIRPHCRHFDKCGGCDYLHLSYLHQLEFKREVVLDQIERLGKIPPPEELPIDFSVLESEYRGKVEFVPVRTKEGLKPGYHPLEPGPPIPIESCMMATADFTEIAAHLLEFLSGGSGGKPHPAAEDLTRLTIQTTEASQKTKELALTLHLSSRKAARALQADQEALLGHLESRCPHLGILALMVKEKQRGGSLRPWIMLKGKPELIKEVNGHRFKVPLRGFFQVSPEAAGQLLEKVMRDCETVAHQREEKPLIFDLFCGVGLYSLPLARAGFPVVGVEIHGESIRNAQQTASRDGLEKAVFSAQDLEKPDILDSLLKKHGKPEILIVNPPRNGLPKNLMASIAASGIHNLIYVSCDSGTFARDAGKLSERYHLKFLEGVDLFPNTHHLELFSSFELLPE